MKKAFREILIYAAAWTIYLGHRLMNHIRHLFERLIDWARAHPRGVRRIGIWSGIVIGVPLLLLFLLPYLLMPFAPKVDTAQDLYAANRPVAFIFYDANNQVAGRSGARVGERLKLEEMPAYLPAAFIAMEDRRFYQHAGIDSWGLLRALVTDLRARRLVQGGSTISQQTAKIVFTNSERSVSRKLSDMLGALALEKALTKKQILELYLNRIYLGSGAYGVDGASHIYFNKSARELSLAEAAMLATLTTAPSVFSPRRDLAKAQARAAIVLDVMVDQGVVTPEQAADARAHPARVSDRMLSDARNFYLDMAAEEAQRMASAGGRALAGDLYVHTALVPKIQDEAVRAAKAFIAGKTGARANASETAVVVMTIDGGIAALIGGVDYAESTFNRATQAHRQPGSSFKPFVYLAALEAGRTPWEEMDDSSISINGWTPTNFGGQSYGTLTLAEALAHSVNTIAVKLAQEVGIDSVIEAARRCGIASPLRANASIALGTSEVTLLEMTRSYAAFASSGIKVYPYFVTQVDDGAGHVLYKRRAPPQERVIASHVVRDLNTMLYGAVASGTGGRAGLWDHEAAGKTGTTQDYHDAWFIGFTADYVAGVWVGNDDSSPMKAVTGGTLPAQIWKQVMRTAEIGLPARPIDRSAPETPIDEDMLSSGLPEDDEARGMQQMPTPPPPNQPPVQPKKHKNILDWLFGSSDDDKPPANEPPESSGGEGN
jgi:penicillin-binding protein 1A